MSKETYKKNLCPKRLICIKGDLYTSKETYTRDLYKSKETYNRDPHYIKFSQL